MTLLARFPRLGWQSGDSNGGARVTTIGEATVVHGAEGCTVEARSMAAALPHDPECDLLVADVPSGSSANVWESVAAVVPKGKCPLRLVPAQHPREVSPGVAQWLSERLGRPVISPCGPIFQAAAGALFVHNGSASGWGRFERGRRPEWQGKRFPRPEWESSGTAETRQLTSTAAVDPLPAGVWLRTLGGDEKSLEGMRSRLGRWIPCQPDILTVVLGGEGLSELPPDAVVAFWSALSDEDRVRTRFIQFGPVRLPGSESLGQALANLFGTEVRCYTGMPVGSPEQPEVFILRADGSRSWKTHAEQFAFLPESSNAPSPRLCAYRPPAIDLSELSPAVYRYTSDTVVEVVCAGLWVRTPGEPRHAAAVRSKQADPSRHLVLYEGGDALQIARMRQLAESLVDGLDHTTQLVTKVIQVTELGATPVRAEPGRSAAKQAEEGNDHPTEGGDPLTTLPWLSRLMETTRLSMPNTSAAARAPQARETTPGTPAAPTAWVPEGPDSDTLDAAREWLSGTWPNEFRVHRDTVEAVLAKKPRQLRIAAEEREAMLVDLVALRMYLAGQGIDVDAGLRAGESGAYSAFGLCVATGLALLPTYRGAAVSTLMSTAAQRAFIRERALVTERGFLNLLTTAYAGQNGDTDLLVWSSSGRLTALFEPEGGMTDRVIFLPRTAFKVLELVDPQPGTRGRIVLRELPPAEITADGLPTPNKESLDKMAKTSLLRLVHRWVDAKPLHRIPTNAEAWFRTLPGVSDG